MKITNVRVTSVNIPLEVPIFWTGGYYPGTSKAIIEVETDAGLIGLGEAPSAHTVKPITASAYPKNQVWACQYQAGLATEMDPVLKRPLSRNRLPG